MASTKQTERRPEPVAVTVHYSCKVCKGTGRVRDRIYTGTALVSCAMCNGTGMLPTTMPFHEFVQLMRDALELGNVLRDPY